MKNSTHRVIIMGISAATLFCVALGSKVRQSEIEKRQEIRRQTDLDLEAISTAATVIKERMDDPEYIHRGMLHMTEDFTNEIAFQKIAVREDV